MKIKAHVAMVMNLDKCIGCHTCTVTCKNTWTNRKGAEYMYWNNVETKPGVGYPKEWENQDKYRGGWELKNGKLELKSGPRGKKLLNIFHNPDLPEIDDYYEPWTYEYDKLIHSPERKHQPVAMPRSQITGERMDICWGPNWEDDLAGAHVTGLRDPNFVNMQEEVRMEFAQVFMMYLPRICEHCVNPACVSACPSGAMYKRDEDGIVLVDQTACRAWRFCVSSCPYKKVYFNWATNKAEKCTLCYPRIEAGMPTICAETCVGRIRYLGIVLYDAERVKEAASVPDVKDLYEAQLGLFLDPFAPHVIAQAKEEGIPDEWIAAAQKSPVYKLAVQWKIALPLHPEYRTLPMVWYVPPLSPVMNRVEGKGSNAKPEDVFGAIDDMRIPVSYLASLLAAGDTEVIRNVLRKMAAMRIYMRSVQLRQPIDEEMLRDAGLDPDTAEQMYRLLAIAKYSDRFVIPPAHRELAEETFLEQGGCSLNFAGGPGACGPF